MLAFFQYLEIALRLHSATPWTVDLMAAYEHVEAAHVAAKDKISPTLLLAIAFVESRYDATATSRVENGVRLTGHYGSRAQPANMNLALGLFCGPMQTIAKSWANCLEMRELQRGYAAGVSELQQWLRDSRVQGQWVLALAGHACGNVGLTNPGTCAGGYSGRVLWMERWIRSGTR
jgi:hypothetical protein